jgi:hypothetical protein
MSKMIDISALYQGFAAAAAAENFRRSAPERRTLRDQVTVDVSADLGTASSPLKKSFFTTANQPNRVRRSQEPKILDGSGISKDTMIGIFGVALRLDHQNYGATLTECRAVLDRLSDSVLEIRIGSEVLCELSGHEILVGSDGFENTTDTATATTTIRSPLMQAKEPFLLEWARICTDQAQLGADLYVDVVTSWGSDNDFVLTLELPVWVARFGSPVASSARLAPFVG